MLFQFKKKDKPIQIADEKIKNIEISLPKSMSAKDAYNYAKQFLNATEAKILICFLTDLSPTDLLVYGDDTNFYDLDKSHLNFFVDALKRRLQKEPLAYILGETEFAGYKFKVDNSVLIPRQETEDLLNICNEKIQQKINKENLQAQEIKILELGTGSGILSICLRQLFPQIIIHATDISQKAIQIAKLNEIKVREQHQLKIFQQQQIADDDEQTYKSIQFFTGDWFKPIIDKSPLKHFYYKYLNLNPRNLIQAMLEQSSQSSDNKFSRYDLILANPPYIAEDSPFLADLTFEPQIALVAKDNGIADIKLIIENSPIFLKPDGWLIFEHGHDQGKIAQSLLAQNGFENVFTHNDLAGLARVSGGKIPTM